MLKFGSFRSWFSNWEEQGWKSLPRINTKGHLTSRIAFDILRLTQDGFKDDLVHPMDCTRNRYLILEAAIDGRYIKDPLDQRSVLRFFTPCSPRVHHSAPLDSKSNRWACDCGSEVWIIWKCVKPFWFSRFLHAGLVLPLHGQMVHSYAKNNQFFFFLFNDHFSDVSILKWLFLFCLDQILRRTCYQMQALEDRRIVKWSEICSRIMHTFFCSSCIILFPASQDDPWNFPWTTERSLFWRMQSTWLSATPVQVVFCMEEPVPGDLKRRKVNCNEVYSSSSIPVFTSFTTTWLVYADPPTRKKIHRPAGRFSVARHQKPRILNLYRMKIKDPTRIC